MFPQQKGQLYRFDGFTVDAARRLLLREGQPVSLTPKAFDLLVVLIESPGQVLTKEQLLQRVWPDQFVEEGNLTVHMSALRRALGERKGEPRFVVTIPGQGYKFVADLDATDDCLVIEQHTLSRVVVEREESADSEILEGAVTGRTSGSLVLAPGEDAAKAKRLA